jgi:hypothetical protein
MKNSYLYHILAGTSSAKRAPAVRHEGESHKKNEAQGTTINIAEVESNAERITTFHNTYLHTYLSTIQTLIAN